MGLLSEGTPLTWAEASKHADHVRDHGIRQFLNIFHKNKDRQNTCLLWGDEVEYVLVSFNHEKKTARLILKDASFMAELQEAENEAIHNGTVVSNCWRPEYGRYMVEGTPGSPYGPRLRDLLSVESNMALRRRDVTSRLSANEIPMTVVNFPRLGCPEFLHPHYEAKGQASHSLFIPDEAINAHKRFGTLTANIRERRRSKVAINVPIFKDVNTPLPFVEKFPASIFPEGPQGALIDHVYMDAMCFGMGCCCLQITFQACNISEARTLYDHLAVVCPLMLALTAASPIWRGYLSDIDCRWRVISASVDDRTSEERGLEPLVNNRYVINKSRYDSIDCYLSTDGSNRPQYNDLDLVYDKDIYQRLVDNGVDHLLARHIAHLFIRDPLVIYKELLDQDDENSSDHFENIQSTNWQTMRFKPPPPNSSIGWRVEFRPMEVQLTDFENAAFAIFMVLLTRAILSFNLNFYIPISKVDENLENAHKLDAVNRELFYFRKNVYNAPPSASSTSFESAGYIPVTTPTTVEDEYDLMTISDIFNGTASFPGLIPLVESYISTLDSDFETRRQLTRYIDLVRKRASGQLMTAAAWMRKFVREHPKYKHDSVVSDEINYDLLKKIDAVARGQETVPELFGNLLPFQQHQQRS